MAITVFVWDPHVDMYGHASLSVHNGPYISWWPSQHTEGLGAKVGLGMLGSRAIASSMRTDKLNEKRVPSWASAPISCLDEQAISRWWKQLSGRSGQALDEKSPNLSNGRYNVLTTSCAGVVFEALAVGGLHKSPLASAVASRLGKIVAPNDLKDVADALSGHFGTLNAVKYLVPTDVRNAWKYLM